MKNSLESYADIDAKVYAALSFTFAQYYRRKDDHENFYQSSLTYLAYTPANELTMDERKDICTKIGMSVLLGKNIFNITELLDKEVLHSLQGSNFQWLYDLLISLGRGDIAGFEDAIKRHNATIDKIVPIKNNVEHLKHKVRIVQFLELLFEMNKDERSLPFALIAQRCSLELD